MTGAALERFTRQLGYVFNDPDLLARALTHRSAPGSNNERLEFLGDGLINFIVAEALLQSRPDADEGELSRLRARLVCEDALARAAERLALGDVLILGAGEQKSGGFRRVSILADTLEAVLGAVYVDGGFDAGRATCVRVFADALAEQPDPAELKDAKTRLQEYLQGRGRPLPVYELSAADGPPHRQAFTMVCRLADGSAQAEGHGSSRKAAEQDAAGRLLALVAGEEKARA